VATELRVDADRLRADFDALAAFGATPEGGVDRPTFSEAHFAARAWFLGRAAAEGLEKHVDAAGNHSAVLPAPGPTVLLGSHLDTVPHGGRFDGALGVIGALHVLLAVQAAGIELPVALEAIDFTDEDGTLVGLLGSESLTGTLREKALLAPRGGRDALVEGLARAGLREDELGSARREPSSLAGYLELHIEQGPVLERAGVQIGVVTSIVGSRSFTLLFRGEANHAGTTPMDGRKDAGLAAAELALGVEEIVRRDFAGCVATVGDVRLEPGAFNVVPGTARVSLEFRAPEAIQLEQLETALLGRARDAAEGRRIELEIEPVGRWEPTPLDPDVCDVIEEAARALGLTSMHLPSGAGHDAQALAGVTRAGMIFVPSVNGKSHDPSELTSWDDCVNGVNVLLAAALALAGRR
jgi:beta-ureidopropionase / N-carbamoyl-L-amino-acid hydrolase